jgi:hypothetical protein
MYEEASQWNWQNFQNEATKREFAKITDVGLAVLDEADYNRVCDTILILSYFRLPQYSSKTYSFVYLSKNDNRK